MCSVVLLNYSFGITIIIILYLSLLVNLILFSCYFFIVVAVVVYTCCFVVVEFKAITCLWGEIQGCGEDDGFQSYNLSIRLYN